MSATVRDVARKAGVSASTVSRVLSGVSPVRDETRARVLEAVSALRYKYRPVRSNKDAANISPWVEKESIGILLPRSSGNDFPGHPTIYSIITAFVDELRNAGIGNSILLIDPDHLDHVETLFTPRYNGYLMIGTSAGEEDKLIPYMISHGIHHVIVNRWMNEKYMNYVNIDDVTASEEAVSYLVSLGHQRIVFIGGDCKLRNTSLRLIGYRKAMDDAGLTVPDEWIMTGEYSEEYGYKVADKLLALSPVPTAAFFCSDMIAIGFQRRCQELGVRLPEQLSMIGYGNVSLSSYMRPALTTVEIPVEAMGRQSALALLNLIRTPSVARVQILLRAPLLLRQSCCELVK
ncbi:MAG: LacI family DNA-binding transcriptional regulator [Christensenellales bacterium]|jgi:LacI family transcriptional regulator